MPAVSLVSEPYLDLKIEFAQALDYVEKEIREENNEMEVVEQEEGVILGHESLKTSQSTICGNCKKNNS